MQEVEHEETLARHAALLEEKVASPWKEKEAMEVSIQGLEAKVALHEGFMKDMAPRYGLIAGAIKLVADHVESLKQFNGCVRTTLGGTVEKVKVNRGHFQEVVRVLQNHEKHIAKTGAASQDMAQYTNALVEENEKKRLLIGNLINAFQEQSQDLQQHEMAQQVIADVVKEL